MKCILTSALCLALLLTTPCGVTAVENEVDEAEIGKSMAPIIGYDTKRGWLLGGAGFLYTDKEPGINAGIFAVSNLNDFHSAGLTYDQRGAGPWSYAVNLMGNRDFDNYYGEGDLTSPQDHLYIRQIHFEAKPSVLYRVIPHLRLGTFIDFRSRQEEESEIFPNEISSSVGLHAQWDTRDKLINTRKGNFFQLSLSQNTGKDSFTQFDVDLRHFMRLSRDLIFASRFIGGTSLGQPSYLFRYRLGGLHLLRGYRDNRFRGDEFFVTQEELRWYLKKWLSVNASIDIGDIRDEAYHQLKITGQMGLRFGLPPGWGQKLRVDFGIGADQSTFQIQFGEIF